MGKLLLGDAYMINNNLKTAREELEMTQAELGFVFGVSQSTVAGWENNIDIIPFNKLVRFCNLYDYSLDFICGFTRRNTKYNKTIKIDKKKIGLKLKEVRTKLKLSQQKFADKCGFYKSTYGNYEVGRYLIKTMTIYTICKTYNISMDWIVGRTNKPKL